MLAAGRYCTLRQAGAPAATKAKSLSRYRRRYLKQLQAGTCWLHAGVQMAEMKAVAMGLKSFDVCRRLVGWQGKQYEGGGNPSNGGSGSDAVRALVEVGMAHEALLPYTDDYQSLGSKPPAAVFADAKASHLVTSIDVRDLDEVARLIHEADTGTCIGIWWPYGWDRQGATIMRGIGSGTWAHELLIIGHAPAGTIDGEELFQLENWHDLLYKPLPPDLAALVEGYVPATPTADSAFWVPRRILQTVIDYGQGELTSATSLDGLESLFDPADAPGPGGAWTP